MGQSLGRDVPGVISGSCDVICGEGHECHIDCMLGLGVLCYVIVEWTHGGLFILMLLWIKSLLNLSNKGPILSEPIG